MKEAKELKSYRDNVVFFASWIFLVTMVTINTVNICLQAAPAFEEVIERMHQGKRYD